ncbi:hypothetical protein KAX29_03345 [candidate division WOR-3 bacterium]|nr:hypothetical protein [candidate division WOR-3 bacterium]
MFGGNGDIFHEIVGPEDISEERRNDMLGKLAQEIVDRGLTTPAIMFIETMKPLSFIGSQLMVMANPFVQVLFNSKSYWEITVLLEDRKNVEYLIQEIERRCHGEKDGAE